MLLLAKGFPMKITEKKVLKLLFKNPASLPVLLDKIKEYRGESVPLKFFRLDKAVEMFKENPDAFKEWKAEAKGCKKDMAELIGDAISMLHVDERAPLVLKFLQLGMMQRAAEHVLDQNHTALADLTGRLPLLDLSRAEAIANVLMNSQHNPHQLKGKAFLLFQLSLTLRHLDNVLYNPQGGTQEQLSGLLESFD